MTTTFKNNTLREAGTINDFGNVFSDIQYHVTLANGVAQSVTVPSSAGMGGSVATTNKFLARFKVPYGAKVRVSNTTTATNPTGTFAATTCELIDNDMGRHVKAGSTLSFITNDSAGADVWVGFYFINQ